MRRGKAGIGFGSGEVREVEGVGLAADKRPAAPDDPFDRLRRRGPAPARRKTETAGASPKPSSRARALPAQRGATSATTNSSRRQRPQHKGGLAEIGQDANRPKAGACRAAASDRSRAHRARYISATIDDRRRSRSSSSAWRASLRAASARRECDGGRTSCVAERRTSGEELREIVREIRRCRPARTSYSVPSERKIAIEIALPCEIL